MKLSLACDKQTWQKAGSRSCCGGPKYDIVESGFAGIGVVVIYVADVSSCQRCVGGTAKIV